MKRRRTLVIAMLLIAALAIGIGYAAVSGALVIDGKVVATAQPFNMHFNSFAQGTYSAELTNVPTMTCADLDGGAVSKSVTLNVRGMASAGDSVTGTLTIENKNDCTMEVSVESILYGVTAGTVTENANEYFEVTTNWTGAKSIDADGTDTIEVTVTMKKSCTDNFEGYFRIALTGISVTP